MKKGENRQLLVPFLILISLSAIMLLWVSFRLNAPREDANGLLIDLNKQLDASSQVLMVLEETELQSPNPGSGVLLELETDFLVSGERTEEPELTKEVVQETPPEAHVSLEASTDNSLCLGELPCRLGVRAQGSVIKDPTIRD